MADIAVFHPALDSRGGGEAVCMTVLEALEVDHDVTFYTVRQPDFEHLNAYYHTEVSSVDVQTLGAIGRFFDVTGEAVFEHFDMTFMRLQSAVMNRIVDTRDHDVIVSTYNEFSFASPAIQYIHYPNFGVRRTSMAYRLYDRLCDGIDGFDKALIAQSRLLTNSAWTANIVEDIYGTRPTVVYPPVDTAGFDPLPWAERDNGFVTVGRIEPSKRTIECIEMVSALRETGHDVHLHVVGPSAHEGYTKRVEALASDTPGVTLEGAVSRSRLIELLCSHRYGLHGKEQEHFGIVVGEMLAGEMIPFVPVSGGQTEIVGDIDQLTYEGRADGIEKIETILEDTSLQASLRECLPDPTERFGKERFKRDIQAIVDDYLKNRSNPSANVE